MGKKLSILIICLHVHLHTSALRQLSGACWDKVESYKLTIFCIYTHIFIPTGHTFTCHKVDPLQYLYRHILQEV